MRPVASISMRPIRSFSCSYSKVPSTEAKPECQWRKKRKWWARLREIIHGILPGGDAELADTSCLNRDTIRTINEGSLEMEQNFNGFGYNENRNSSNSFSNQQGILVKSRQFRKQTEVIIDIRSIMII